MIEGPFGSGDACHLTTQELQTVLGLVVKEYSTRLQAEVDDGQDPSAPLVVDQPATTTDMIVAVRNMLRVYEIAPFELSMLGY